MHWLLLYEVVDDYVERRRPLRERHLALARVAASRGELLLAGAFAEPVDGAALVFRADDVSVVEAFVAADPYVREGLVTSWWIRPWSVVVGGDMLAAAAEALASTTGAADDTESASGGRVAAPRRRRELPLRASRGYFEF